MFQMSVNDLLPYKGKMVEIEFSLKGDTVRHRGVVNAVIQGSMSLVLVGSRYVSVSSIRSIEAERREKK